MEHFRVLYAKYVVSTTSERGEKKYLIGKQHRNKTKKSSFLHQQHFCDDLTKNNLLPIFMHDAIGTSKNISFPFTYNIFFLERGLKYGCTLK